MANPIFGPWPDVPAAEGAPVVPTPVGSVCHLCDEPIRDGEFGTILQGYRLGDDGQLMGERLVQHAECGLMNVTGSPACAQHACNGPGSDHTTCATCASLVGDGDHAQCERENGELTVMSRHEQARWVWDWVQRGGLRA